MIDWNGDGKHDVFDSMIDYQIYKEVMENKDDDNLYSSKQKNNYQKVKDNYEFEKYAMSLSGLHLLLMLYLPIASIVCFYFSKTTSSYRSLYFIIAAVVHIIAAVKLINSPAFEKLKEGEKKKRELTSSVKVWILAAMVLFIIGFSIPRENKTKSNSYSYSYSSSSYRPSKYSTTKYDAFGYDSSSSTTTTTRKTTAYSRTTTAKRYSYDNSSKYDYYDVYDYDDPEDFYEDNYDDFYDYEDAEDYFYEAWDS